MSYNVFIFYQLMYPRLIHIMLVQFIIVQTFKYQNDNDKCTTNKL